MLDKGSVTGSFCTWPLITRTNLTVCADPKRALTIGENSLDAASRQLAANFEDRLFTASLQQADFAVRGDKPTAGIRLADNFRVDPGQLFRKIRPMPPPLKPLG